MRGWELRPTATAEGSYPISRQRSSQRRTSAVPRKAIPPRDRRLDFDPRGERAEANHAGVRQLGSWHESLPGAAAIGG